jgi:hypothetical protein
MNVFLGVMILNVFESDEDKGGLGEYCDEEPPRPRELSVFIGVETPPLLAAVEERSGELRTNGVPEDSWTDGEVAAAEEVKEAWDLSDRVRRRAGLAREEGSFGAGSYSRASSIRERGITR